MSIADYFCWAIQRVFEVGETRFYDYIENKISVVWDIFEKTKYDKNARLTEKNKVGSQLP